VPVQELEQVFEGMKASQGRDFRGHEPQNLLVGFDAGTTPTAVGVGRWWS